MNWHNAVGTISWAFRPAGSELSRRRAIGPGLRAATGSGQQTHCLQIEQLEDVLARGVDGGVVVVGEEEDLGEADGLADLATYVPSSGGWRVCLSTADGEFVRKTDGTGECPIWVGPTETAEKTAAGDFNGDGHAELATILVGTLLIIDGSP